MAGYRRAAGDYKQDQSSKGAKLCGKSRTTAWWEGRAGCLTLKDGKILTAVNVQGGLLALSKEEGKEGTGFVWLHKWVICVRGEKTYEEISTQL